MSKKCSLCGGRLQEGVCVECGLDNSKNDSNYTRGESACSEKTLTHAHTADEDPYAQKTMTRQARAEIQMTRKQSVEKRGKGKKNLPAQILTLLIFIVTVGGAVIPWLGEKIDQFKEPEEEVWSSESSMNQQPYYSVTRELPETGEAYEVSLSAGLYKCGVHIPEGNYKVVLERGTGSLQVEDEVNYISLFYSFGNDTDNNQITQEDDIRIYKGALVSIDDDLTLHFKTENAQMELEGMQNPNTESRTLTEKFVAGKDIPAGAYDVYCDEGSGIFEYYIKMDGYDSYEGKLIGDNLSTFPHVYNNIVLPDGVEVTISGMKVTLVPSETIESEDYEDFYPDI